MGLQNIFSTSRQPPLHEQQDLGSPLLRLLFDGQDLRSQRVDPTMDISVADIMIEGLQLTTQIHKERGNSGVYVGKRLIFDPTNLEGYYIVF